MNNTQDEPNVEINTGEDPEAGVTDGEPIGGDLATQYLEALQRERASFINYKRRAEQERAGDAALVVAIRELGEPGDEPAWQREGARSMQHHREDHEQNRQRDVYRGTGCKARKTGCADCGGDHEANYRECENDSECEEQSGANRVSAGFPAIGEIGRCEWNQRKDTGSYDRQQSGSDSEPEERKTHAPDFTLSVS